MALKSMSRLTNVFLALFMLLSIGLVYWQVIQQKALSASVYNPRLCDVGNQPVRGSIYDRNGVLLAYSEYDPKAPCNYRRIYCFPSLSPLIGYFSYIYGKTGIEEAYDNYLTGTDGAGQTTLTNFWDQTLHRPIYGADLYLTIDWRVQNLIDKEYDTTYDNPGNTLRPPFPKLPEGTVGMDPATYKAERPRCDQNLASQIYVPPPDTAAHYHPGSTIVEDPKTGEILGMLTRPYFDANKIGDYTLCRRYTDGDSKYTTLNCPNAIPKPASVTNNNDDYSTLGDVYFQQLQKDRMAPLLNRPTEGLYAPGSTFKTVTLSAALDSGKYQLSNQFGGSNCLAQNSEARSYTVNFHTFEDIDLLTYNPPPACPIDLEHGYIYSDNIIFARVGVGVGADTWLDYAKRYGITDTNNPQSFPFDFPVQASRLPFQGDQGVIGPDHQVDLAASAFGQGALQVTPLTMEFVTSTVANNGLALRPHLLYKVVPHGADPKTINPVPPTPYGINNGQIISPQTASQIRLSMRGVVQQGSAFTVRNSVTNIGGKTGTAQLGGNLEPHSWFISLAPDGPGQTPQYAVTVMRENADEGLLQGGVADCIMLSLLPGIGNTPLENIHDGTSYPRFHCIP
jgi:peptidoglycan glycosyltransferase